MRGDPSGPVALETKLGWLLSGPAAVPTLTESCTVNLSATHVLKIESADISRVQDDLLKFWDLETLGIRDTETSVHDKFSNEIRFTGERYQVNLPFKDNHLVRMESILLYGKNSPLSFPQHWRISTTRH